MIISTKVFDNIFPRLNTMFYGVPVFRRGFASASGGDKPRVFFGLTRLYSLRDRRIKAGPPQPRKVPFHRLGVSPPGTKYFCRDFKNPTVDISNASFMIEYRPFLDMEAMEKAKSALKGILRGSSVTTVPVDGATDRFRVVRVCDKRVLCERSGAGRFDFELADLKALVSAARNY